MIIRQLISLLALSALTLPAGIASAGDVDIQTGTMRVRVREDGTTTINSTPKQTILLPQTLTPSKIRVLPNRNQRYSVGKNPKSTPNLSCNGRSITQQSTQRNGSGTAVNRTYSSTTTTSC